MNNLNLFHELEKLLRDESRYCSEDGILLKNAVVEAALAVRPELIKLLLTHEGLKANFFTDLDGLIVFDKVKFQKFVMNKRFLPDSYTSYKNKIGLTGDDDRFLSESREVVLSWPYKDCVLEGGQTKEDAKRDEVFWNEILAPDEINRLTEPKVLTNFRRYDSNGDATPTEVSSRDNIIIKGNNLLTLHSLRKKYRGRVKLIYIDPPYYFVQDKKEDTFAYNTNFKRSTWCAFMRNRLEIARELLSDDGAIFVQISDDGVAELHLLMKEIFNQNGENNFINKITVRTKSPSGFASVNPGVFETAEYILAFAKHKSRWTYNTQYVKTAYDDNYAFLIINPSDPCDKWEITRIDDYIAKRYGYENKRQALKQMSKGAFFEEVAEFALQNKDRVFRLTAINNNAAAEVVVLREKSKINPGHIYCLEREGNYTIYVTKGQEVAFYAKKVRLIDGEETPSMQLTNMWNDISYEGIAKEGGVQLKGGKKPERLLRRIIEMATNPNDLVLDFFAGSGTTASVSMKMNRRFVTCEQLDSNIQMSVSRLKSVVAGDKTGISEVVNWQGGGSFVYCELAAANQRFADRICAAGSTDELRKIWEEMRQTGFLSWKIDPKTFNENVKEFEALSLDEQKLFLIECLDKNLLYVPLSEIDNAEFDVSDSDKRLNTEFYDKSN